MLQNIARSHVPSHFQIKEMSCFSWEPRRDAKTKVIICLNLNMFIPCPWLCYSLAWGEETRGLAMFCSLYIGFSNEKKNKRC
jgi:hypothetical protein